MFEFTPTTEQVRDAHAELYHLSSYGLTSREEANELFDRWLASVRSEAWDEGVARAETRGAEAAFVENPYQKGESNE